jgi:hypothetical protein
MHTGIMLSTALLVSSPGTGTPDAAACQAIGCIVEAPGFAEHLLKAVQMIWDAHADAAEPQRMVRWAVEGLYAGLNEPVPHAIAVRLAVLDKADRDETLRVVRDARVRLGARKELAGDGAIALSLEGLFARMEWAADPKDRSGYIRKQDCFIHGGCGQPPVGIGVRLKQDSETGMLLVVTPIYNGPAHKAGLRGGDLITHIRLYHDEYGSRLPEPRKLSTKGMTVEQAEQLLLGREGTRVTLTVIPATPRVGK